MKDKASMVNRKGDSHDFYGSFIPDGLSFKFC